MLLIAPIIFLIALSAITVSATNVLIDTETLWEHADDVRVCIGYVNATSEPYETLIVMYNLSDIATYYNGYIYVPIPAQEGYPYVYAISLGHYGLPSPDGGASLVLNDLIEFGISRIDVWIEFVNSSALPQWSSISITLMADCAGDTGVWYDGSNSIVFRFYDSGSENVTYVINKTIEVDVGALAATIASRGIGGNIFGIFFNFGIDGDAVSTDALDYIKFKISFYSVSEKRLLQFITEPAGALFSGLVASIVAAARRAYEWITACGFAGFSFGALLTGLTESWVVAAIIAIAVIIFVWLLFERK